MVNEDIITILRNGIERGESLEVCKRIAINSGYNPREVEEASHFISRGTMTNLKQQNPLDLIMPNKKSFSFFKRKPKENIDMNKKENPPMTINQNKQKKKEFTKEIILFIGLFCFIGIGGFSFLFISIFSFGFL